MSNRPKTPAKRFAQKLRHRCPGHPSGRHQCAVRRTLARAGETGELRCRVITADQPLNPAWERPGMPHWSTCRNPPTRGRGKS